MRIKSLIIAASIALVNPAAHADSKDTLKILSAMMMGGGLGAMITSCGGSKGGGQGCQMGTLLTMMGGVGLLFGMQGDKPKEVRCYTDNTGQRQAIMYGADGQQYPFRQPAPGQPIAYPATQLPPAYAQNLSGQVMQLCNQPQLISTVNAGFAAPPGTYPLPAQLQPVNPVGPAVPVVGGVILPRSVASEPWAAQAR